MKLITILSARSFFKNNKEKGPNHQSTIIPNNCFELEDALNIMWESSKLFLYVFHILQPAWRCLREKKHYVKQPDRQKLLKGFKSLIYTITHEELDNMYHVP